MPKELDVLIDARQLARRVPELAADLRRDAGADTPIHLVGVLQGAFVFLADLMRAIDGPVSCDFIAVSSYGDSTTSSGEVRLTKDLDHRIEGRYVVIVEDIVDTGVTLAYLQDILRARAPRSLRTMCLLRKRGSRRADVAVDYVGFDIDDRFVVGYGLDWNEQYRQLPHIAVLAAVHA
jgi:hypoxanthine phosphoribosyltransferase